MYATTLALNEGLWLNQLSTDRGQKLLKIPKLLKWCTIWKVCRQPWQQKLWICWFWPTIHLLMYPSLRNLTTNIAITHMCVRRQNFFHQNSHFPAKPSLSIPVSIIKDTVFNVGNSLWCLRGWLRLLRNFSRFFQNSQTSHLFWSIRS